MNDPLDYLPTDIAEKMRAAKKACSVPCPTCGAGIGKLCLGRTVATDTHPARKAAVR